MSTWKPEERITKRMLLTEGKWPSIALHDDARRDAKIAKARKLRARYWDENGAYLCRVVVRAAKALAA